MKVCLKTTGMFCQREKDCGLNTVQQNEKSTKKFLKSKVWNGSLATIATMGKECFEGKQL